MVSSSDDPAAGGSTSSPASTPAPTPEAVDVEAGKKRRVGDCACACLQLAHGARVRVAADTIKSRRSLFFVLRRARLGTMVRLILMRILFRASDLGQIAKKNSFVKIEKGFLCRIGCGDDAWVICFFSHAVQQLGLRTQKIQANIDYYFCVRRAPSALRSALDSSIRARSNCL